MKKIKLPGFDAPFIDHLIEDYFAENEAARTFVALAERMAWLLVVDHAAVRCLSVEQKSKAFLACGYHYEDEKVEYPDQGWWAKVYRKTGYPSIFIDQAYDGVKGEASIIPAWVARFGGEHLHHVAVLVEDIDAVLSVMQQEGVLFSGSVVGSPGSRLRQIFSASEVRQGAAYTVLELTERNHYSGFYPDQANQLMQSSTTKKSKS